MLLAAFSVYYLFVLIMSLNEAEERTEKRNVSTRWLTDGCSINMGTHASSHFIDNTCPKRQLDVPSNGERSLTIDQITAKLLCRHDHKIYNLRGAASLETIRIWAV